VPERHPDKAAIRLDTGFVHEAAGRAMAGRYDSPIRVMITEGKLPASDIRYDKFG